MDSRGRCRRYSIVAIGTVVTGRRDVLLMSRSDKRIMRVKSLADSQRRRMIKRAPIGASRSWTATVAGFATETTMGVWERKKRLTYDKRSLL